MMGQVVKETGSTSRLFKVPCPAGISQDQCLLRAPSLARSSPRWAWPQLDCQSPGSWFQLHTRKEIKWMGKGHGSSKLGLWTDMQGLRGTLLTISSWCLRGRLNYTTNKMRTWIRGTMFYAVFGKKATLRCPTYIFVLSRSVVSDSCDPIDYSPPASSVHGDSPGKNTGVGCHALLRDLASLNVINIKPYRHLWINKPSFLETSLKKITPEEFQGVKFEHKNFMPNWVAAQVWRS